MSLGNSGRKECRHALISETTGEYHSGVEDIRDWQGAGAVGSQHKQAKWYLQKPSEGDIVRMCVCVCVSEGNIMRVCVCVCVSVFVFESGINKVKY